MILTTLACLWVNHSIQRDCIENWLTGEATCFSEAWIVVLVQKAFSFDLCVTVDILLTSASDDVIKWKHFPRYWPFVRGIHRSLVDSHHKGQWRGAVMLFFICAWTNGWANNRGASDLTRYDVTCNGSYFTWYHTKFKIMITLQMIFSKIFIRWFHFS